MRVRVGFDCEGMYPTEPVVNCVFNVCTSERRCGLVGAVWMVVMYGLAVRYGTVRGGASRITTLTDWSGVKTRK